MNYTSSYKYIGFYLDGHMSFLKGTVVLTESAGRALGGVIGKTKALRSMGSSTYAKLYQACVFPVLGYATRVWGYKVHKGCEQVHNRAIRYFLGVN